MLQGFSVNAQSIRTVIRKDGTFDIIGTTVKINNCYPALDNKLLKPIGIKVVDKVGVKTIQYTLIEGSIELRFGYEGQALKIDVKVNGQQRVSNFVSVLRDAEVTGANKVYKTNSQIMGFGGVKDWPSKNNDNSSCAGVTGLIPDSGYTMVISTRDFRKYMSYINLSPMILNGGRKLLDVVVITENVSFNNLPSFYFSENTSAYDGMRNEAGAIAKVMGVKTEKPQSYHWCSWYYAFYHLTEGMLSDYLKGFKTVTPPVKIQTIQIDAGYFPHAGDWLEASHKFPKGIEGSAKEILANNYKAGIWIGPYMVGNKSKLYLEHPNWILRQLDGSPIVNMTYYGEERLWGAMDEEIYTLDTSNPEVMEHLRNVFRTFKKMGFTFFKTDFMLYGAESSNNVKRHTPGKTSIEYQREFFDMIRQEIGPESFWLGCIAPFEPMLGYVDAMRVAADISPKWQGATNMFDESRGNQHINNVWWQNDADAMILRKRYSDLSDAETKSIALWIGMLGGVINTSDLFHDIPKERTELFRFLEPTEQKLTSNIPSLTSVTKSEVLVRKYPNQKSWAILFLNRQDEKVTETYNLKELIGINNAFCFDWDESQVQSLGSKTNLSVDLKPHESRLVYVSIDDKGPGKMTLGGVQR
jgi:hypothetical protein